MSLNRHLANVSAYVSFIQALKDGGSTIELVEQTGLAESTVKKFIAVAHRRGLVHIKSWDPDTIGRARRAVWALGEKPDAPRPRPLTSTQRSQAKRARDRDAALRLLGRKGAARAVVNGA